MLASGLSFDYRFYPVMAGCNMDFLRGAGKRIIAK